MKIGDMIVLGENGYRPFSPSFIDFDTQAQHREPVAHFFRGSWKGKNSGDGWEGIKQEGIEPNV